MWIYQTHPNCKWRSCGPYHVVGLALVDLGLQGLDLELGLLQLADTLTRSALVLAELTLLLIDQPLKHTGTKQP